MCDFRGRTYPVHPSLLLVHARIMFTIYLVVLLWMGGSKEAYPLIECLFSCGLKGDMKMSGMSGGRWETDTAKRESVCREMGK